MTTEAQTSANRVNAQKSTGPRTAQGKAAVALNAVQHGLRAQAVVLPGEEPDEYDRFRARLLEDLQPRDLQEREQAQRIVELAWQLRRAGRYHGAVFDALYEQQAAEMAAEAGEAGEPGPGDRVLGQMLVADFSGPRVLERVQLYERRIENSFFRARAEWDKLRARPRRSDRPESVCGEGILLLERGRDARDTPVPQSPLCQTKPIGAPPAGGKDAGGTNKANVPHPAAGPQAGVNERSQWQPPAAGGPDSGWTNKAKFAAPIGILGDLAAHKRLPARSAM